MRHGHIIKAQGGSAAGDSPPAGNAGHDCPQPYPYPCRAAGAHGRRLVSRAAAS